MATYNNSLELEDKILKSYDNINFYLNDEVIPYYIVLFGKDKYYLANSYSNTLIIQKLSIINTHKYIEKIIGYTHKDFGVIMVSSLEDLTKITINLFKISEKIYG